MGQNFANRWRLFEKAKNSIQPEKLWLSTGVPCPPPPGSPKPRENHGCCLDGVGMVHRCLATFGFSSFSPFDHPNPYSQIDIVFLEFQPLPLLYVHSSFIITAWWWRHGFTIIEIEFRLGAKALVSLSKDKTYRVSHPLCYGRGLW